MSHTDQELLANYARDKAEDAFAELVRRHLDLVFSAALRQVRSPHLAEEVAQSAFVDLARQAPRLAANTVLSAWLYRVTCRTAIDVVRRESRRQAREQVACDLHAMNASDADWTPIEPFLDEAMNSLDESDRAAVLLRYFENKSLREVGFFLGTNEDAARKRVNRAVDRLRDFFVRRGISIGLTGLAVILSANAVHAAPSALAVTITTKALAGTAAAGAAGSAAAATNTLVMTTLQKALIIVAITVAAGTPLLLQHQSNKSLRQQNEHLLQLSAQLDDLEKLKTENSALSNQLNEARNFQGRPDGELLRLRAEVGALRRQTNVIDRTVQAGSSVPAGDPPSARIEPATGEFPRESWNYAGYAEPQSGFQSLVWAMGNGDLAVNLASLSPAARDKLKKRNAGQTDEAVAAQTMRDFEHVTGFRIVGQSPISENETVLRIEVDGAERPGNLLKQNARMVRIGNEWKFDGWAKNSPEQ